MNSNKIKRPFDEFEKLSKRDKSLKCLKCLGLGRGHNHSTEFISKIKENVIGI